MSNWIFCFVIALFGFSCSGRVTKDPGEALGSISADRDPSIALQAPNGAAGHACPVNGYVLTASHVLWDETLKTYVPTAWSDGYGQEGSAAVSGGFTFLDLISLSIYPLEGYQLDYLPPGYAGVGDRVYWYEFDLRTRSNALRARRRFADVLRIVAGHYILDDMPVEGASGSCLLNSNGEVVGVINAGWDTDDSLGVGVAVKLPLEILLVPGPVFQ
jgi:hypothetical protein